MLPSLAHNRRRRVDDSLSLRLSEVLCMLHMYVIRSAEARCFVCVYTHWFECSLRTCWAYCGVFVWLVKCRCAIYVRCTMGCTIDWQAVNCVRCFIEFHEERECIMLFNQCVFFFRLCIRRAYLKLIWTFRCNF